LPDCSSRFSRDGRKDSASIYGHLDLREIANFTVGCRRIALRRKRFATKRALRKICSVTSDGRRAPPPGSARSIHRGKVQLAIYVASLSLGIAFIGLKRRARRGGPARRGCFRDSFRRRFLNSRAKRQSAGRKFRGLFLTHFANFLGLSALTFVPHNREPEIAGAGADFFPSTCVGQYQQLMRQALDNAVARLGYQALSFGVAGRRARMIDSRRVPLQLVDGPQHLERNRVRRHAEGAGGERQLQRGKFRRLEYMRTTIIKHRRVFSSLISNSRYCRSKKKKIKRRFFHLICARGQQIRFESVVTFLRAQRRREIEWQRKNQTHVFIHDRDFTIISRGIAGHRRENRSAKIHRRRY